MHAIAAHPALKWIGAIVTVFVIGVVLYLGAAVSVYVLAFIVKLLSGNV